MEGMPRDWEARHAKYMTFKAESEVAIQRFNAGEICSELFKRALKQADEKLTAALKS